MCYSYLVNEISVGPPERAILSVNEISGGPPECDILN